jgi:hypothetical protein
VFDVTADVTRANDGVRGPDLRDPELRRLTGSGGVAGVMSYACSIRRCDQTL